MQFFVVLVLLLVSVQSRLSKADLQAKRILGGMAIGFYGAALLQLTAVPLTYSYERDILISIGVALVLCGYLIYKIYIELTAGLERKLHASRQERLASIGRLAAVTAHEIRNPLQAIRGFAQILGADANTPDQEESAGVIVKETDRLDSILHRLLSFSRDLKLKIESTKLSDWWAEQRIVVENTGSDKSVKRSWSDAPDHYAEFDPDKMRQVFINLFKNAIDASPDGGEVRSILSMSRGWVTLRIEDQGSGVDPDNWEAVFKEFHTTKTEGSGLGLPISKRIVEAHGGRIYFDTDYTSGAAVVVEWPVKQPKKVERGVENA